MCSKQQTHCTYILCAAA